MAITEATRAAAAEIIARYPAGRSRSALLPMLHLVQAEEGYVTPAGIAFCAEVLGLTKAEVAAVATFYSMYKRRPVGEYLVSVCTNLSCQILGGEDVYARLSARLGVGHDETTADGLVTLEHAECLAACDYAPVMTINYEFFDNVTPESAEAMVDAVYAGEPPTPTRGAPLCSFREISRQLAGFRDPRAGAVRAGVAHPEPATSPDSRGARGAEATVGTTAVATDTAPRATYAVPGGVTERVLSDADAAATYADPRTGLARPDAGAVPLEPAPEQPAGAPEPPASPATAPVDETPER